MRMTWSSPYPHRPRPALRNAPAAALLGLVTAAIGCGKDSGGGGDEDSSSGDSSTTTASTTETTTASTTVTTTASTTVTTTATSTADSSSSAEGSSSTTDAPPACGDGNLDDGEMCDDGNDIDGDGCNNDCVESGVTLWSVFWDGPVSGSDWFDALAFTPEGDVVATGGVEIVANAWDALVVRYDGSGSLVWDTNIDGPDPDPEGGNDGGRRIAVLGDGTLRVAGGQDSGGTRHAYLGALSGDGDESWSQLSGGEPARGIALAVADDGTAYVGVSGSVGGRILAWSTDGAPQWSVTIPGNDAACMVSCARPRALLLTDDGLFAGGTRTPVVNDPDAFLALYDDAGNEQWLVDVAAAPTNQEVVELAQLGDGSILALVAIDGYQDHELRSFDVEGNELGTPVDLEFGADTFAMGMVAVPGDAIVVAGYINLGNALNEAWIGRYGLDGAELWRHDYPGEAPAESTSLSRIAYDGAGRVAAAGATWDPMDQSIADAWVLVLAP